MPAPKGNEFWRLRSKDGKPRSFDTPDDLWAAAVEYFEWADANPLKISQWVGGKDAGFKDLAIPHPYSIKELCVYLEISEQTFYNYESKRTPYEGYFDITARIRAIIYVKQVNGAVVGMYKENIIARITGLTDKREISGNLKLGMDLADEEYK